MPSGVALRWAQEQQAAVRAGVEAQPAAAPPVLEARGLVKRFGGREALKRVSLAAAPGELVAVIGPNGAGKTTLLSILAGIQRPDEGAVSCAPAVGWVPQSPALYGKLTVRENLDLFARLERCPDPGARVERMLELTGLRERAGDQAATLSAGNRQRVNIALGLLAEPPVLLLDEPSAALDPRQRARLWEFILGLARAGTTVVYATHDVREADRYAQQVVVLADGERLFSGPLRELEALVGTPRTELGDDGSGPAGRADFEAAFVAFLHARGH
jgi:ABC-2 type transport system ATP-binding protein